MKIILKYLLLLLISFSAFSNQEVTIYTYDILPPFAFQGENSKLTGIYIEIVKTAIARMPGYSVKFKVLPWARVKRAAETGEAFAILPPYFHAHDWLTEKKPHIAYIWPYSLPLYTQKDVVICNQNVMQIARKKYPDDFIGLKFVMWQGDGRAGEQFTKFVKNKKIFLSLVPDTKTIIPFLLTGRAQCTVAAKVPFAYYLRKFKDNKSNKAIANSKVVLQEAIVISENAGFLGYTDINAEKNFPFKKDFSMKFDIEIYKMKRNGDIKDIVRSFILTELIK